MLNIPLAKEALKKAGLRLTKQRNLILEILSNNYNHPTAEDLIVEIEKRTGHVTVATVYNTLEVLSKQNIIKKIDGLEAKNHYDPNIKPHYHAICVECKKIYDLEINEKFLNLPESFQLKDCLIQGLCKSCKNKELGEKNV